MTTRKAIIYSLLIPQAIVHLILFIAFGNETSEVSVNYIGLSLITSLGGLFLGILICARLRNPKKEPWFYFAGQILAFGLFLHFNFNVETEREKKFRHAREYYQFLLYPDSADINQQAQKVAIIALESKFDEPNSFVLTNFYTEQHDTLVAGIITYKHAVYFAYETMEKDSLFSKIIVFKDSANIEKFNADGTQDEELQWAKSEELFYDFLNL